MPNLIISWDNPVDKIDVASIVLYKKENGTSCYDTLDGDLILETTNLEGSKGFFADDNVDVGIWRYAAFSKNAAGLSPCATSVFQVYPGPTIDNPLPDISVYESPPPQTVSLVGVFGVIGGSLSYSVSTNLPASLGSVLLVGTDVLITINPSTVGTFSVNVTATVSTGASIVDSFGVNVSADNAPVVSETISDLESYVNAPDVLYDLSNIFSDVDGDTIIKTAVSSHTSKATVTVSGNLLTVSSTTDIANIGLPNTTITITGTSNNKSVSTDFEVSISQYPPGAFTTWSNIGRVAPNPISLPGGIGYVVPGGDEGDTSRYQNNGNCLEPLVGTLNARWFFQTNNTSDPCASVGASTGPYAAFDLDQWYLFTIVRKDNTAALYINGVATAVVSLLDHGGQHNTALIGSLSASTYQNDWCWNGLIDQAAVWSRAISASEVLELYNTGTGRAYANMSPALATGLTVIIEPAGPVSISAENTAAYNSNIKNQINNANIGMRVLSGGQGGTVPSAYPVDVTRLGGKVSPYSFTPCYDSILRNPPAGTTKTDAIDATELPRAALRIPGNPWPFTSLGPPAVTNVSWSTSVWINKYGEARSYNVAQKILNNNYSAMAGGCFIGDYSGFANNLAYANLFASDMGNRESTYALWNL